MILIVDFGSQYTQLLARRVRELSVYSEIISFRSAISKIDECKKLGILQGIILSGGPQSVYAEGAPTISKDIFDLGLPILGICYGLQLLNVLAGGKVEPAKIREYGYEKIILASELGKLHPLAPLANILPGSDKDVVWMSHGDEVSKVAPQFVVSARTSNNAVAAVHHASKPIFGLQFHPEVEHSRGGRDVLRAFVLDVCQAKTDWDRSLMVAHAVKSLEEQLAHTSKETNLICALSGGVDSAVAAVLTQKVVGSRLHCIFVNNGLLRKDEFEQVLAKFKNDFNLNVHGVDSSKLFLDRLAGISDPETKRKIIGATFIEVFEAEAKKISNAQFLVQGTLYTDVIESVSIHGSSVTIKSHHNVGGLPEKMALKLVEPLRELFKDEVRVLGRELGIAKEVLERHPFPGPGLAIRVLGEVTPERLAILRDADEILIDELRKNDLYNSVWQAFVVLLPVQSVGVMGDGRTYENVCAVRCVSATDGMTAEWSRLPHEFLAKVSTRIINEVRGINRVVYDISSKPPATIEWE
jgi:GMP synthase (glutamine-hydrolysing)